VKYPGRFYRYMLGLGTVAGSFALLAALLFIEVPTRNEQIVNIALGLVLGWGGAIVGYEFGGARKTGTQSVKVENETSDPVPVEASK
jgi:hypothetical protein